MHGRKESWRLQDVTVRTKMCICVVSCAARESFGTLYITGVKSPKLLYSLPKHRSLLAAHTLMHSYTFIYFNVAARRFFTREKKSTFVTRVEDPRSNDHVGETAKGTRTRCVRAPYQIQNPYRIVTLVTGRGGHDRSTGAYHRARA